jgi:hypothetical protein
MMPQDCPDYSQADANQLVEEADKLDAKRPRPDAKAIAEAVKEREAELAKARNDPDFGDYNIPPGGNHP